MVSQDYFKALSDADLRICYGEYLAFCATGYISEDSRFLNGFKEISSGPMSTFVEMPMLLLGEIAKRWYK